MVQLLLCSEWLPASQAEGMLSKCSIMYILGLKLLRFSTLIWGLAGRTCCLLLGLKTTIGSAACSAPAGAFGGFSDARYSSKGISRSRKSPLTASAAVCSPPKFHVS